MFADPEEAIEFVELLREMKWRDGLTVFAWALLSNHYHIVLRTSAIPLSRTMQYVQGTYSRRDRETAALRKLVAAVGIERWGQRAGELGRLLDKHTVAVSRWVSDAARERQTDPAYEKKLLGLDEQLSERALAAQRRGDLAPAIQQEQ